MRVFLQLIVGNGIEWRPGRRHQRERRVQSAVEKKSCQRPPRRLGRLFYPQGKVIGVCRLKIDRFGGPLWIKHQAFRSTAAGTSSTRSLRASATQGRIQPSAFSSRVRPGHSI